MVDAPGRLVHAAAVTADLAVVAGHALAVRDQFLPECQIGALVDLGALGFCAIHVARPAQQQQAGANQAQGAAAMAVAVGVCGAVGG
jgi:hypothetical protein